MARKMNRDDPDTSEITAELFARMRPMRKVAPALAAAHKALRGRPRLENPKAVVSVRLSAPAKQAWDTLPTKARARIVTAMERAAIKAAQQ